MQKDHHGARRHPDETSIEVEQDVDEREIAIVARERRLEAREALLADRAVRQQHLLDDADKRDDAANARDVAANRRDISSGVAEFLENPTDTTILRARGAAALDRAESRRDRAASKSDRSKLTDDE